MGLKKSFGQQMPTNFIDQSHISHLEYSPYTNTDSIFYICNECKNHLPIFTDKSHIIKINSPLSQFSSIFYFFSGKYMKSFLNSVQEQFSDSHRTESHQQHKFQSSLSSQILNCHQGDTFFPTDAK